MSLPVYASLSERIWHYTVLLFCALGFVFLIAPILIIFPLSFNAEPYFTFTERMLAFDPSGYSLRWYDQLVTFGMEDPAAPRTFSWWLDAWNSSVWIQVAKNSVMLGVAATLVATGLGTLAALGLSKPEMPFRGAITAILISPMIVPVVITATGLFFFYSKIGLTQTFLGLVLSHALVGVPFVIITVTATLMGFNHSLRHAAASLGATPFQAFRRVVLPLIQPGVISGALFAFAASFDEVVLVLFIGGPDQQTIPRQMFNGMREQISPTILAAATILVGLSIALLVTVEMLRRRAERMRGIGN